MVTLLEHNDVLVVMENVTTVLTRHDKILSFCFQGEDFIDFRFSSEQEKIYWFENNLKPFIHAYYDYNGVATRKGAKELISEKD